MREKYKKFFLAGFIEGDGSLCISIKRHPKTRFGFVVDPEFYIYQHESGKKILEMAQEIFHAGRIYPKPGNSKVFVFAITTRRTIWEKVIPFFEDYVMPFTAKFKRSFPIFRQVVELMEREKAHQTPEGMRKILHLVMEFDTEKGKPRKHDISELLEGLTPQRPYAGRPREGKNP